MSKTYQVTQVDAIGITCCILQVTPRSTHQQDQKLSTNQKSSSHQKSSISRCENMHADNKKDLIPWHY